MSNYYITSNELYHFGILGMHWGVRRYQNKDGSLTEEGKKRYYNSDGSFTKAGQKEFNKDSKKIGKTYMDYKKHGIEGDTFAVMGPTYAQNARQYYAYEKRSAKKLHDLYETFDNKWGKKKEKDLRNNSEYLKYKEKGEEYVKNNSSLVNLYLNGNDKDYYSERIERLRSSVY
jgi:hypothetical protein